MKIMMAVMVVAIGLLSTGCSTHMRHTSESGEIRHVVLFKYKESATPAEVAKINEEFAALKTKIPQVAAFEWGTNISPEGLNQGLTHAFIATFRNAADRDAYLVHPAHKAFVELLKPSLDKATVIDFSPR